MQRKPNDRALCFAIAIVIAIETRIGTDVSNCTNTTNSRSQSGGAAHAVRGCQHAEETQRSRPLFRYRHRNRYRDTNWHGCFELHKYYELSESVWRCRACSKRVPTCRGNPTIAPSISLSPS